MTARPITRGVLSNWYTNGDGVTSTTAYIYDAVLRHNERNTRHVCAAVSSPKIIGRWPHPKFNNEQVLSDCGLFLLNQLIDHSHHQVTE